MRPQPEIEALNTYARDAAYIEEPNEGQYRNGVAPLDTLPAAWWNWFWRHITQDEALLAVNLNSLYEEAINVLSQAGIEPDETQKNQLYAAINTFIQNKSTELQAQIDTEVTARLEGDNNLSSELATERQSRIDADSTLTTNLNNEITNRTSADTTLQTNINTVSSTLSSHTSATSVHSAVSTATASRIVIRDSSGRAQVATPSDDNDIATKYYVDNAVSGTVDMYKALTSIQGTEALVPLSLFNGFVYDSSHRYAAIALFISSIDTYLVTSCYVTSSGVQVYPRRIENDTIVDGTGRTQLSFGSFTFGNNYTFGQMDPETYVPVLIYIFDGGSV